MLLAVALLAAGCNGGIVDRHALTNDAATIDSINCEAWLLAGSVLTMIEAVRNLLELGVPFEDAVGAATSTPARVLGERELGRLDVGLPADLVVLNDRMEIERVLVAGEVAVAA